MIKESLCYHKSAADCRLNAAASRKNCVHTGPHQAFNLLEQAKEEENLEQSNEQDMNMYVIHSKMHLYFTAVY